MISQWSEVDLEMFYEIFNFYKEHRGHSEDKIIEIQNLSGKYYEEVPYTRIFLGSKINPLDYREWNTGICAVYDTFKDQIGVDQIEKEFSTFNLCFVAEGMGPMITPFGPTDKNIKTFFATSFGDMAEINDSPISKKDGLFSRLILWFTRDKNGKIIYDMSRKQNSTPDTKRLVRIRTMDFSDWKKVVDSSIIYAKIPDDFAKDDVRKEDFGKVIELEGD